jgi:hypothetical protein
MKTIFSSLPLRAQIAGFELRDARASREGAFKELLLLEKHLSQEMCAECCHKHLFCAIAYLEEARTLDGGDAEDTSMAKELRSFEEEMPHVSVRPIRKRIGEKLGFGVKGGPS